MQGTVRRHQRVVQLGEERQQRRVGGRGGRVRADRLLDPHQVGGDVDGVDQAERLHAEQRRAEAGALVPGREPHGQAEHVGEHLPPQRAAGEPAGRADLANLVAGRPHRVEHQRELLADALQRGPDQVLAAVRAGQPDVRAARQRAPVRRALAVQVRQHDQPAGAGRHPAGQVEQLLRRLGRRARGRARRRPTRARCRRC